MGDGGPLGGLRHGAFRYPDSLINSGGPLPSIPPGAVQFTTPDGIYNSVASLLPGGLESPYAFGRAARISTQTQQAHPNRVALVIHKLYLPAPESDGVDPNDPVLQHALSDGDLAFTFRMSGNMTGFGSQYVQAPYGFSAKAVPLMNLATVNYVLWGLQVGLRGPKSSRWRAFFTALMRSGLRQSYLRSLAKVETVWDFIKTFIRPFGVQHGHDSQGGGHEGNDLPVIAGGAVDYVSSFAIEGKLRHINNLWRDYDVREHDDLILALRWKEAPHADIPFVLSSSVRATRNERAPVLNGFFYLRPETLEHRSFSDVPYIHVARALNYCGAFRRGVDGCCWDARAPVIPGAPLHATFEPLFVDSDQMHYRGWEIEEDEEDAGATLEAERATALDEARRSTAAVDALAPTEAPPHLLPPTARTGAAFAAPAPPPPAAAPPPPPTPRAGPAAKKARVAAPAAPPAAVATTSSAIFAAMMASGRGASA